MGRKAAVLAKPGKLPPPEPLESIRDDDATESLPGDTADDGLEPEAALTDNVGEQSIEINVENLIAELEAESQHGKSTDVQCARHKLEDYLERKRIAEALEDFEDFVVED
jgi:hypothetical protein